MTGEDFKNYAIGGGVLIGLAVALYALKKGVDAGKSLAETVSIPFTPKPGEASTANPISRTVDALLFGPDSKTSLGTWIYEKLNDRQVSQLPTEYTPPSGSVGGGATGEW